MPEQMPGLGVVLAALTASRVRFILIGGLAMAAYGSELVTQDADIFYDRDPENLAALASALAPFHPSLRGSPPNLPFVLGVPTLKAAQNLTLTTNLGEINLLCAVPGVEAFQPLWERAVLLNIYGLPIRVASLDDMIAMKRAANRPKDQFHLQELHRLKKDNL